jgi:CO dehydrogenase maturation factor
VRSILAAGPAHHDTIMVTDMEAGLEHLSRATTRNSDVMLIVAEPYYKSLETAARVHAMTAELGIPRAYLVANKIRSEKEAAALEAFCRQRALPIISTIPYDERVLEASLLGCTPLDLEMESAAVTAVREIAAKLLHGEAGQG